MVVCFIGHRTINNSEEVRIRLQDTISRLISNGADTFLFGSKSKFDTLCWQVVTELKVKYPKIKRICYNVPNEVSFTSKEECEHYEQLVSKMVKNDVHYADYEEAVTSQKSQNANKNVYIMRNQEMIDNSDICVFYYNKDYLPPKRKLSLKSIANFQPQSGTALAFAYATRKKKNIINLYKKDGM